MNSIKRNLSLIIIILTGLSLFAGSNPKNVIIMISDGWSYDHIKAADFYQYGESESQSYENFPVKLAMSTYPAISDGYSSERTWYEFKYRKKKYTDSAAAATAMSTGYKTKNGKLAYDREGNKLYHISERAKELNKSVGVVTSVMFSHATPAGFIAHNESRNNYQEIAREMILHSRTDVIMGCGHPFFDRNGEKRTHPKYKYVGGEILWNGILQEQIEFDLDGDGNTDNYLQDCDFDGIPDKWSLIQNREEFQELQDGETPRRVLGVPQVYKTLQYDRKGDSAKSFTDDLIGSVPTLVEMSNAALNILANNPQGFFLMIEGGAVDWASHNNDSARMIEEQIDFNLSVDAVIDWINKNSSWEETLLIVTGDHECGYLTGPGSGKNNAPKWNEIVNKGKGNMPEMEWHSDTHTNALIPFYASGMGAELFLQYADEKDLVRGDYIDNTEIAIAVFRLWE